MAKTDRSRRRASSTDRKLTRPDKAAHRVNTHRANGAASTSTEVAPKGQARRGPRSQVLPGLDAVRSKPLDNICEGIGDCRDQMNAARTEEKRLLASALQTMQKKDLSAYRHARVELARIPGAERLRVHVTKEEGDAAVEQGTEHTSSEPEEASGEAGDNGDQGEELRPGVMQEHDGR